MKDCVFHNTFLSLHSKNVSDMNENVLEDFSGRTEIGGVTQTDDLTNETISGSGGDDIVVEVNTNEVNTNDVSSSHESGELHSETTGKCGVNGCQINSGPKKGEFQLHEIQKPKFLDLLKRVGTTTLIIMGLVMSFLLFMGYRYLFN